MHHPTNRWIGYCETAGATNLRSADQAQAFDKYLYDRFVAQHGADVRAAFESLEVSSAQIALSESIARLEQAESDAKLSNVFKDAVIKEAVSAAVEAVLGFFKKAYDVLVAAESKYTESQAKLAAAQRDVEKAREKHDAAKRKRDGTESHKNDSGKSGKAQGDKRSVKEASKEVKSSDRPRP